MLLIISAVKNFSSFEFDFPANVFAEVNFFACADVLLGDFVVRFAVKFLKHLFGRLFVQDFERRANRRLNVCFLCRLHKNSPNLSAIVSAAKNFSSFELDFTAKVERLILSCYNFADATASQTPQQNSEREEVFSCQAFSWRWQSVWSLPLSETTSTTVGSRSSRRCSLRVPQINRNSRRLRQNEAPVQFSQICAGVFVRC